MATSVVRDLHQALLRERGEPPRESQSSPNIGIINIHTRHTLFPRSLREALGILAYSIYILARVRLREQDLLLDFDFD